jgi:hypothetical protein
MRPEPAVALSDFAHAYDSNLKERFTARFRVDTIPTALKLLQHPNGRTFYPNECYLAYWRAYVIFEAVAKCKFIDKYLSKADGSKVFKQQLKKVNERWQTIYAPTFERLSHYITFTTFDNMIDTPLKCTYGVIANHLFQQTDSKLADLVADMGLLLALHQDWVRQLALGQGQFELALKSLKRDIYFLFEWLCCAGFTEREQFARWQYKDRQPRSWSQLQDVLDFEEIAFKEMFELYVPIYSEAIESWIDRYDVAMMHDLLAKFDSFKPWLRAFCDLHTSINKKGKINLVQPRVLDTLLVITIRAEVLLRAMYKEFIGEQEPDKLQILFKRISAHPNVDNKDKQVLATVCGKVEWKLAELHERPEDVFAAIEQSKTGKQWTTEQKFFFKSILKFVASRNYFAHHYYMDHEFENHTAPLCGDIVKACLHSILYVASLLFPGFNKSNKPENRNIAD